MGGDGLVSAGEAGCGCGCGAHAEASFEGVVAALGGHREGPLLAIARARGAAAEVVCATTAARRRHRDLVHIGRNLKALRPGVVKLVVVALATPGSATRALKTNNGDPSLST